MGEGKQILKLDGGEEIKPCTDYTYLGTKIDQLGDNNNNNNNNIYLTAVGLSPGGSGF
jgi:hypothetical protein